MVCNNVSQGTWTIFNQVQIISNDKLHSITTVNKTIIRRIGKRPLKEDFINERIINHNLRHDIILKNYQTLYTQIHIHMHCLCNDKEQKSSYAK